MVEIKGLEKLASKDFPEHIASSVFLGGCNFRCPFCHNAQLVLEPETLPSFPWDVFAEYLDSRRGWLEGVCVTGGEPLMHTNLKDFLKLIKDRSFLVKLDTNGAYPRRLENLISQGLVNFLAMDIKAPLEIYEAAAGVSVNIQDIQRSMEILRSSNLNYVFRTTVVPGLIQAEEIQAIAELLQKDETYILQGFIPQNTINAEFLEKNPYTTLEMREFARIAEKSGANVKIEGE